jgi:hypothetical protein
MRNVLYIICLALCAFSCVKTRTESDVPKIDYKNFVAWKTTTGDTAVLTLSYEDGDGDLFRDETATDPNIVIAPYYYDEKKAVFVRDTSNIISNRITQPDNGYYKGKSIKGDIIYPMSSFRSSNKIKMLKMDIFMVDMNDHKSNIVTTPVYTVTF